MSEIFVCSYLLPEGTEDDQQWRVPAFIELERVTKGMNVLSKKEDRLDFTDNKVRVDHVWEAE